MESKEEMIEMMDKIPGSFRTILNSEVQMLTEYSCLTRSSVQNDDGGEDQGGQAEHSHQLQAGGGEGYPWGGGSVQSQVEKYNSGEG